MIWQLYIYIYIYDTLAHTVTSVRDPGDVVEMFGVRNAEAAHAVSVAALLRDGEIQP